jgi:hypothetical protein
MENYQELDNLIEKMALYLLRNGIFMTNKECEVMKGIYYHLLNPLVIEKATQNYQLN